jgi:hypothetical protein
MSAPFIEIAGRRIGADYPPYVICELSGNHNGSLERCLEMVDAAADTGCDAIKIQTYTADTITLDVDRPEFKIHGGLWDGRSLYELYQEVQTPFEWHAAIFERARQRGVTIFSSPFDETAVDLLDELGAPAFKIASFEAVDLPLIRYAAAKGKPLIISTGMANLEEMKTARDTALAAGAAGVLLLHCVSSYPATFGDANVRTIPDMAARFDCPIGLSDHTPGTAAAVAAVALGGLQPGASRVQGPGRRHQERLGRSGRRPLRRPGRRARQPAVPPLALRHRRRQGRRDPESREHPLGPSRRGPAARRDGQGAGPPGDSRHRPRRAAGLVDGGLEPFPI